MSGAAVAMTVIVTIVALGGFVGFYAGARHKMDLEQWTVAGRGFGVVMVWLLMAGEVYTTFSLLGASGWAYDKGGPTLYIIAYITLAYVVSFYMLPEVWQLGRDHGLQTESDFFEHRYRSKHLAAFVAVVAIAFIVPYLQLQLTGLGIIVEVASFGGIGRTPAMVIGFGLVAGFVLASGVRAVAWISVLKDILLLFAAVFVGVAVPHVYFGGVGPMFSALAQKMPAHLMMPGSTPNLGHPWFISSVLLSSLGFYMWPHAFASSFTARDPATLRRNAVVMPLYTITLPLIFFVGFGAILIVPGLKSGELSFLTIVRQTFPPWFLGLIGGAGALTAMVPSAILLLSASALFAKNIYRPLVAPAASDSDVAGVARALVVIMTVLALYFAIYSSSTLVSLLLLGYAGVTQFFPGVILGLYWNDANRAAVFAGMVVGLSTVAILVLTGRNPFLGLDAGFCALCLNFATVVGVSFVARQAGSHDGQSGEPADYGLDAPEVIRNLLIAVAVCLLLWGSAALRFWSGNLVVTVSNVKIVFTVAKSAFGIAFGCALMAIWMTWYSKFGKIRSRERLLDRVPWTGTEQVLDVGCGRGLMLVGAARRLTSGTATGIDIWQAEDLSGNRPEAPLENARREGVADRVRVRTADMRQLPFPDRTFDVVVSCAAIHNLYSAADRAKAIREIARVLKPGGQAVIDDIRHHREYMATFAAHDCQVIRRLGSRVVTVLLAVITMGGLRPATLIVRKAA